MVDSDLPSKARRGQPRRRLIDATCHTCARCRQKKVKCDGNRPECSACRLKGQDCEYPKDARKSVTRTKKADVISLQRQIEELKQQVNRQSPREPLIETPEAFRIAGFNPESDSPELTAAESMSLGDHSTTHRQSQSHEHRPHIPQVEWQREPRIQRSPSDDLPVAERSGELDLSTGILSPRATTVEREINVYGATSLLHDQSSEQILTQSQTTENKNGRSSTTTTRDHLVANAALRKQEEIILFSTRSIASKMDFDGVPMDTAMHLLDLHWNRQHLSYLITYRPAIMDSLVNKGPYVNKLLLNAIYVQSSLYSDRKSLRLDPEDPQTVGMVFYSRFKALLADYIDKPSLPTVVALLTCGACLVPHGKQSAGWVFCGMAHRMMIDLGYHLETTKATQRGPGMKLSPIDIEMRRRVYWGAYVSDIFQSLFLGRSPAMQEFSGNISSEYLDSYEEMEEWTPYLDPISQPLESSFAGYRGRPTYAVSTFRCLLQLCEIASRIIRAFYSTSSFKKDRIILIQTRHEIRQQLHNWKQTLPTHLQFDPGVDPVPPPHQITPHTTYWALIILTEQAFLDRGHFESPEDVAAQTEGVDICIQAALKIWRLVEAYKGTFTLRRAQYGISYATYCAALVMLQKAHRESTEHIECVKFLWSALLQYQKGCSIGLSRPLKLLESLFHKFENVSQIINLDEPETAEWRNRRATEAGLRLANEFSGISQPEFEYWGTQCMNYFIGDDCFLDDTVFGMFMSE